MGCDGGTIPKRHELVRTAKRPEQKDKDMDRKAKWSTCTITQQALSTPIVTCELGKLYSKESVLEFLLDRSICETAAHLRNMKDIKVLNMTPNPGFDKKNGTANEYYDTQSSKFVCPIVGIEMNGKYRFYALWSCGCVMSERAFKEVESETCHNCGASFVKEDIIILNAEGDDLEKMEANMKNRREALKKIRKEKKDKQNAEKRKADEASSSSSSFAVPKSLGEMNGSSSKKAKLTGPDAKKESKKSKTKSGESAKKALDKKDDKIDVTKSKVYKSLFSSSENKNGKDKQAHWVTYNPYHL